jgi:DNA-directed RNA polymerase subunit K/omega
MCKQVKPHKPHMNALDGKGRMTRFERAKVLGFRALQLEEGHAPRVETTQHDTVFTTAEREFDANKLGDILVDRV